MRPQKFALGLLVLLLPFVFSPGLLGDDTNYQNFLVGDRAAGMGGAVAATTDDLDACYYNPAGLARVSGSRIALSVSLYGIQEIRITDGLGEGENFKARDFESIPSTFGSILKVSDDLALAFSVFTPDEIDLNVRHSFERRPSAPETLRSDYYSATFDDSTLWIGPSFGWRAGERLSLGAGVYLLYRSAVNKQEWAYLYTSAAAAEVEKVLTRIYSIDLTNYGLLGLVGAQYELTDEIALGAAVQTPSLNITGSGEMLYAVSLGDPESDELVQAKDMKSRNHLPARLTLGAAWRRKEGFTLEANCSYHLPTSYLQLRGEDTWTGQSLSNTIRREGVVNFNLGGEYYIVEHYPVRAGVFTNLSSSPGVDRSNLGESLDDVDMYGVSFSVGNESEHTTFSLGVNYVWGSGKTVGIGDDFESVAVDQSQYQLFVFLSSAYIF